MNVFLNVAPTHNINHSIYCETNKENNIFWVCNALKIDIVDSYLFGELQLNAFTQQQYTKKDEEKKLEEYGG